MKNKQIVSLFLKVLLCVIVFTNFSIEDSYADQVSEYLKAVQNFADRILASGIDTYGTKTTPLFVDGLHTVTLEPVKWKCRGETWILCNFASQQPLLRTLDGLTSLTGQKK